MSTTAAEATEQIVSQIENQLRVTRDFLIEAKQTCAVIEADEARLIKALKALAPNSELIDQPKPKKGQSKRKQVSDDLISRVREVVAASKEPMMVSEIAPLVGSSRSAVLVALQNLRERDEVRLAGRAKSPGGPNLFVAMS